MRERHYPGGLTLEQWQALPRLKRYELAARAQCELLGSFRLCSNKACRRARSCCGDPDACRQKLWQRVGKKPKRLREEYSRLGALVDAS